MYSRRPMDPHVELLRNLFATHPAWLMAGSHLKEGVTSIVRFTHVPGEFHLLCTGGKNLLMDGPAKDPDLAFRFTPGSIERLSKVTGQDIADFGVELLECAGSSDPAVQVRIRVLTGFSKLLFRGYVGLLMRGGPRVLAYGGKGTSFSDVRKVLSDMRAKDNSWDED